MRMYVQYVYEMLIYAAYMYNNASCAEFSMAKNVSLASLHVCVSECVTNLHNFLFSQLSDGVNISITDEGSGFGYPTWENGMGGCCYCY